MSAKAVLVFCAQALFVQSALSQCTSRAAVDASGYPVPYGWAGPGLAYDGFASPLGYDGLVPAYNEFGWAGRGFAGEALYPGIGPAMDFIPTSGGALPVTSSSAIPPTGITLISENVYEGALAVTGELPFVGTTAFEGVLPTSGAGAINHACGNGVNAMVSDITAFGPGYPPAAYAPAAAMAPAYAAAPYAGRWGGCGRDLIY